MWQLGGHSRSFRPKPQVQLAGKVGEGVMKAVNAMIQGIVIFLYQPAGAVRARLI